jgi:hypothetical protein
MAPRSVVDSAEAPVPKEKVEEDLGFDRRELGADARVDARAEGQIDGAMLLVFGATG